MKYRAISCVVVYTLIKNMFTFLLENFNFGHLFQPSRGNSPRPNISRKGIDNLFIIFLCAIQKYFRCKFVLPLTKIWPENIDCCR